METERTAQPEADEIRHELGRVLESRALAGSDQLKRLLRTVVERSLNGQTDLVKEYNLGLEVFGRPPDYDPKVDPIVRVQARRLRAKIEEYYAGEGASSRVMIRIPKGGYSPIFEERAVAEPAITEIELDPRPTTTPRSSPVRRRWALAAVGLAAFAMIAFAASYAGGKRPATSDPQHSIAVLPLKDFTDGGRGSNRLPGHMTELLTTQLARVGDLRVVSRTTAASLGDSAATLPDIARKLDARWIVEGGLGSEGSRIYLKLRVVDATSDRKVWADVFDAEMNDMPATASRVSKDIAAAVKTRLDSR